MAFKFINSLLPGKDKLLKKLNLPEYTTPENLPVKVFFEILKTQNLNLLNPKNLKVNQNVLRETWAKILSEYQKLTNNRKYIDVLNKEKKIWIIKNKITTLTAILLLIDEQSEEVRGPIEEALKEFGLNVDIDSKRLNNAVKREKSRLELLEKQKLSEAKKEEVNFWQLVAQVENSLGRQIDVDNMTLAHWVETIKIIKLKNKEYGKQKRGRKI